MTTHEPTTDDIESLKAGQLTNCESIRSLAQSVSHLTPVISQLQKRNEDIYNNDISEHEEGPLDTEERYTERKLTLVTSIFVSRVPRATQNFPASAVADISYQKIEKTPFER
jgi:hypothetical protein